MKKFLCAFFAMLLCFSTCSQAAFAAKNKIVKTGLKAEKVSSFNVNSSDKLSLANTKTPVIAVENKSGEIRFVDVEGNDISDKTYDTVSSLDLIGWGIADSIMWSAFGQSDILMVGMETDDKDEYKCGLIGTDGVEYFPCEYDKISLYDDSCCVLFKLDEQDDTDIIEEIALFDVAEKQVYPIEIPEKLIGTDHSNFVCNLSEEGYVQLGGALEWDEMYLYIYDPTGEMVFSETESSELDLYDSMNTYWDYSGFFSIDDAFYNDNGELLYATSTIINSVGSELGLMKFYDDGGYGLMDMEENIILEPEYDLISFSGEFGYVKKDEKYALTNKSGELITEFVYDSLEVSESGITMALKGNKVGLLDANGEEITDFIFDEETISWGVSGYGCSVVSKDGKIGIADEKGKMIIKPEIEGEDVHFNQNLALIKDFTEDKIDTYYMRSGAIVSTEYAGETDNYDLFETHDKNKTALVDFGGNVLVKGGENSEYIAVNGSEFVLGLVGKTVNVYQLISE